MTHKLDINQILTLINSGFLDEVQVFEVIDSTNNYLLERIDQNNKKTILCVANEQTAGRGRLDRKWASPAGSGIYLSLLWPHPLPDTTLSLVIGVSLFTALEQLGANDLKLKWPNDILWHNKKLAGILIETKKQQTVIGIGVNINLPKEMNIDQPVCSLSEIIPQDNLNRNNFIAQIINQLILDLTKFEKEGFIYFQRMWNETRLVGERDIDNQGKQRTIK